MTVEDGFRKEHRSWINTALKNCGLSRKSDWSESITIGRKSFTAAIKRQLKNRAQTRTIIENNESSETTVLKERAASYSTVSDGKKDNLSHENTYSWRQNA